MYNLVSHLNLICSVIGFIIGLLGTLIKNKNKTIYLLSILLIIYSCIINLIVSQF